MNRRRNDGELGQGVVEFAVIFPLFIFLVFMVIDGGLIMGRYNDLNHAAKEGARLASTGASDAEVVARVKAQSQGLLDDAPATSTCAGDRPYICVEYSDGPAPASQSAGEVGSTVKVIVRYQHDWLTPLVNAAGDLNIDTCAVMRLERPLDAGSLGTNTC